MNSIRECQQQYCKLSRSHVISKSIDAFMLLFENEENDIPVLMDIDCSSRTRTLTQAVL